MLLATVWRHAAICELYRDETSLCWSHDASTDEAYPPRARSGGFRIVVCAPITVGLPALTSARNGWASVPVVGRDTIELDELRAPRPRAGRRSLTPGRSGSLPRGRGDDRGSSGAQARREVDHGLASARKAGVALRRRLCHRRYV